MSTNKSRNIWFFFLNPEISAVFDDKACFACQ